MVSCDMIRIILKMRPKMALIDPSPLLLVIFFTALIGEVRYFTDCCFSGQKHLLSTLKMREAFIVNSDNIILHIFFLLRI